MQSDKCEVRCRNCHATVTYERMGSNWRSEAAARRMAPSAQGVTVDDL